MAKKMLIDATHPEETRVVVVDGNKVEDFDFESINKRQLAGNIYLAKVTRVEPSLQAAFVDYGGNRHGFLAFAEIHPDYYQIPVADREALLAEEEAAEQARAREEEEGDGRRGRRRRGKGRDRSKPPAAEAADAVAAAETPGADEATAVEAVTEDAVAAEAVTDDAADNAVSAVEDAAPLEALAEAPELPGAQAGADGDNPSAETPTEAPLAEAPLDASADAAVPEMPQAPTPEALPPEAAPEAIEEAVAPEATDPTPEATEQETPSEPEDKKPPRTIAESTGSDRGDEVSEPYETEDGHRRDPTGRRRERNRNRSAGAGPTRRRDTARASGRACGRGRHVRASRARDCV